MINLIDKKENTEEKRNPLGVKVQTSAKGSMTQVLFYDYCQHFVHSLPANQGKNKLPVILFLDGHVSCWNLAALRFLILNNVYPFFLASHTSIWSQPNDNGIIKRLHSCIKEATISKRRWNQAIVPYFNTILAQAWMLFLTREANDLVAGANNATSAYSRTGLFPFNPLSDSWEEAIESLGFDNALNMRRKVTTQWEIQVIRLEDGRVDLSEFETKAIRTGWTCQDYIGEVESSGVANNVLLIAKLRGDGMLAKWRAQREHLLDSKKYEEAQLLTPSCLNFTDEGDKAALKLIKFVESTSELPMPFPENEEERRKQVTFNILNNTLAGTGAVRVELLKESMEKLTSTGTLMVRQNYCCSGIEHCIVNSFADPKKHTCPICKKGVHAICGVPNPDFQTNKVGIQFSTICMLCLKKDITQKKYVNRKKELDIKDQMDFGLCCLERRNHMR